MIYYFNIDDTICESKNKDFTLAIPYKKRILEINELYNNGNIIIYWSSRNFNSNTNYFQLTLKQLNEWGCRFTELKMEKPIYDLSIDNKNVNSDNFFNSNLHENSHTYDYIIICYNSYIGNFIYNYLKSNHYSVYGINNISINYIEELIIKLKPKYIINTSIIFKPDDDSLSNVDKKKLLLNNVIEPINILNLCNKFDIICVLFEEGDFFKKTDKPVLSNDMSDLDNNYHSLCHLYLEELIQPFQKYILLRISNIFSVNPNTNTNDYITKLKNLDNIETIELSFTNLETMIPIIPKLLNNNDFGLYNFVNLGQLNLLKLIHYYNIKNKTIIPPLQNNTELYPDRLIKYDVKNINNVFSLL